MIARFIWYPKASLESSLPSVMKLFLKIVKLTPKSCQPFSQKNILRKLTIFVGSQLLFLLNQRHLYKTKQIFLLELLLKNLAIPLGSSISGLFRFTVDKNLAAFFLHFLCFFR